MTTFSLAKNDHRWATFSSLKTINKDLHAVVLVRDEDALVEINRDRQRRVELPGVLSARAERPHVRHGKRIEPIVFLTFFIFFLTFF